jgi:molecular chaperone GrpE
MADNKKTPEENTRSGINPNDRDGLKRAADEILKKGGKASTSEKSAWANGDSAVSDDSTYGADITADEEALVIEEEISALQSENTDMKDRLLRLAADMENLRRRTEREVRDARAFAISGFARDMLAVSDNLRRALEHVTPDQRESADDTLKTLLEGVELTERSMHTTMERHGVRKLEPEGQKFDPNFHQAMFEVPNAEVPNNTVVQVVQAGYQIGERVLRPAMVGVAKGGPKQAAEPEPGAPNPESEKDA